MTMWPEDWNCVAIASTQSALCRPICRKIRLAPRLSKSWRRLRGGPTSAPPWTCASETLPESSIAPAWQLRETPNDDGRGARADEFALARCALAVPWRGRGCVSAGDHWRHSTECNERLPPSPAPSRSTAGLKKRSFLYGPAHRAQMLAKAQGGRLPALRTVVAKPYLAAQ